MAKKLFPEEKERPRCKKCGRILPKGYKEEYCNSCKDDILYRKVKEYVLTHDCTEQEVAEKLSIPLDKIHEWIGKGYMSYKNKH